jgi:hypothetical protein
VPRPSIGYGTETKSQLGQWPLPSSATRDQGDRHRRSRGEKHQAKTEDTQHRIWLQNGDRRQEKTYVARVGTGWKSPTAHEQKLTRKIKRKTRALNLKNQVCEQKAVRTNFPVTADTNRSMRDSRDGKTWRKIGNLSHVTGKQITRGNKTYEPQIQRERNGDTTK